MRQNPRDNHTSCKIYIQSTKRTVFFLSFFPIFNFSPQQRNEERNEEKTEERRKEIPI